MRKTLAAMVAVVLLSPLTGHVQDGRAALENLAKAMGATTLNLADNITRLGLAVDQLLPLHGRIVPLADLNKAIGR